MKNVVSRREQNRTAHAHTIVPHSLSPVLGATNPLAPAIVRTATIAFITRLHFRHKNHNVAMLAANVIKCSAIESYDVKYKYIYIWRNLRPRHWLPDKSTYHDIINKTQYKMVCPTESSTLILLNPTRDKCALQTVTSGAMRQCENSRVLPDAGIWNMKMEMEACELWINKWKMLSLEENKTVQLTHTPLFPTACRLY